MPYWQEPYLTLHVVWHPSCNESSVAASRLIEHFTRERYSIEDMGVSIFEWSNLSQDSRVSGLLDLGANEAVVVIVLISDQIQQDRNWSNYVTELSDKCLSGDNRHSRGRLFPVAVNPGTLSTNLGVQALRWCDWNLDSDGRSRRLVREVTYETSRMLRTLLVNVPHLDSQTEKVQVFLSHSKHDDVGLKVAQQIRNWIFNDVQLSVFLDVTDVPPGLPSDDVLENSVRQSAVLIVYSDSYSSREWCMREVLVAKESWRPIVIADCIEDLDERAFPYLGNVPLVRLCSKEPHGIERIVGRLLDEVLKDFLWQFRTAAFRQNYPNVMFARCEPELLTLLNTTKNFPNKSALVYPGPPLSLRELGLLDSVGLTVQSLSEWMSKDV